MKATVAICTLRHLDVVVDLFEQYRQFYKMAPDVDGARQFLGERLRRNDSIILLATEGSGCTLGFTQLYPMFSSTRMSTLWMLNDLYVIPGARGQGVGRMLMKAAHAQAMQNGVRILALATQKENVRAKRLYESLGYVRDTEFDHYELAM